MGLGSALGDKKVLESALEELSLISSQKPITCLQENQLQASNSEKAMQLVVR